MRVFAVAHILHLFPLTRQNVGEVLRLFTVFVKAREVVRNRGVVLGGVRKNFLCKCQAHLRRDAPRLNGGNYAVIVRGIHDHGDGFMVLRRRTDHRGSADVDVFNREFKCAVRTRNRLFEGVKVHAHDIDRADVVFFKGLHVFGNAAARENPGVNVGVKRLHATVQHFGKPGVVRHFAAGNAFLREKLCGAPRRKNAVAQGHELTGEIGNARLVGNADQSLFGH